ncbi:MAG: hypothetical protein ACTSSH_02910 [Candidatus Heimdallarchaeota archaeon]
MTNQIKELKKQIKKHPEDDSLVEKYVNLLADQIITLSRVDKVEECMQVIADLEKMVDKYPENKNVVLILGQAIVNALPLIFAQSTITEVKQIINGLRNKSEEIDSIVLTEFLAMALVNEIYDFSLINHVSSITEFALELSDLARKHPNNEIIQTAGAKGMMNATVYFLQKQDMTAARKYFETLNKIMAPIKNKDIVDSRQLLKLKEYFES